MDWFVACGRGPGWAGIVVCLGLAIVGCRSVSRSNTDLVQSLGQHSSHPLEPLANSDTVSKRELRIRTADSMAKHGHRREAIALLLSAEAADPNGKPLDRKLAPLLAQEKDFDESLERYRRALQESPDDLELHNNYAWTLMESGQLRQAMRAAEQGLKVDLDDSRLASTLAAIHYRSGDRQAAFDLFRKHCGESGAHHNLALLDIDAGNIPSAIQHASQSIQSSERAHASVELYDALLAYTQASDDVSWR